MKKFTLKDLLDSFQGKLLDLSTTTKYNGKTYYITDITYSSTKGIQLICSKNQTNNISLRKILEILCCRFLESLIDIYVNETYLDITNLVILNNTKLVIE